MNKETKPARLRIEDAVIHWLENYIILYGYDASKELLNKISAMVELANRPGIVGLMRANRKKGGE